MFMRVDRLQANLPKPLKADPNAAAALQELLGGKFGEMSTLNNYMFQSFNFRNKEKLRPFYSLVASITAEELGHVELVTTGINMVAAGPDPETSHGDDVTKAPFADMKDMRLAASFLHAGGAAMVADSNGLPWNGTFVFSTGNLVLDLLHNFFLECGARMHKLRVYETLSDPTGREVCGYLLVRGSVHAHAYALALKQLTGVRMEDMLPVPKIDLSAIPEAAKYQDEGAHRRLYTWGEETYRAMESIWGQGEEALPGDPPGELEVVHGMPDGAKMSDLKGSASAFTPEYEPEEIYEIAAKLMQKM